MISPDEARGSVIATTFLGLAILMTPGFMVNSEKEMASDEKNREMYTYQYMVVPG